MSEERGMSEYMTPEELEAELERQTEAQRHADDLAGQRGAAKFDALISLGIAIDELDKAIHALQVTKHDRAYVASLRVHRAALRMTRDWLDQTY